MALYSPSRATIGRENEVLNRANHIHVDCGSGGHFSATADLAPLELVGASATFAVLDTVEGGAARLHSNSTTDTQARVNGGRFSLSPTRNLKFECKVAEVDADGMSAFFGLVGVGNAAVWTTSNPDWIGFFNVNSATLSYGCAKNSDGVAGSGTAGTSTTDGENSSATVAPNLVTMTNGGFKVLSFFVHGTSNVKFYVDGIHVGTKNLNLPDDVQLTPTIGVLGSGEDIDVVYLDCYSG